jgi:hypothetical protein
MFSVEVFVNRIVATWGCKADEPKQLTVPLGDNIFVPFIKRIVEQTPLVFGMLPKLPRIDFVSRSINALPIARAGQSDTDLRSRRNPLFSHWRGELSAFARDSRKLWRSTDYNCVIGVYYTISVSVQGLELSVSWLFICRHVGEVARMIAGKQSPSVYQCVCFAQQLRAAGN